MGRPKKKSKRIHGALFLDSEFYPFQAISMACHAFSSLTEITLEKRSRGVLVRFHPVDESLLDEFSNYVLGCAVSFR